MAKIKKYLFILFVSGSPIFPAWSSPSPSESASGLWDALSRANLDSPESAQVHTIQAVADNLASSTGVAISPLVVAGGMGCFTWLKTPDEQRHKLSLFYQPVVWGSFLLLGLLFTVNSIIGTLIPFLKKPMDLVESIEHPVSGFVIGLPLILLMQITTVSDVAASFDAPSTQFAGFFLPGLDGNPGFSVGLTVFFWVPVILVCFFSVWALSQFVNLLILLSPWGAIDLLLRGGRAAVLACIFLATLINPWLGILLCALIVVISLLVLRFTFRATCFSLYFLTDLIMGLWFPKKTKDSTFRAYSLKRIEKIRKRSIGRLERLEDGSVVFRVGKRSIVLAQSRLQLCDSFFGGIIVDSESSKNQKILRISKRYRLLHSEVAAHLGLDYASPTYGNNQPSFLQGSASSPARQTPGSMADAYSGTNTFSGLTRLQSSLAKIFGDIY